MTKNCNTCRHHKHDNPYCECCFDLDKYEKERRLTNQEAITIIGNLEDKDILYNPCDVQDAKTMAIKALEQESSGDLISRQAVIEACEQSINILEAVDRIMDLPSVEQEPKTEQEDDYFRKIVEVAISQLRADRDRLEDELAKREQESRTGQFAKWVATEIFDELWEYNKDAFPELACRKLAKLGIVRAKGDEWELVKPQEGSEE